MVKRVRDGVVYYADYTQDIKSATRASWHMGLDRFVLLYNFDPGATRNRSARLAAGPATPAADPTNVVAADAISTDPRTSPYVPVASKVLKQYKVNTLGAPARAVIEGDGIDLFYQLDRMSGKGATLQLDFKAKAQQPQEVIMTLQCERAEPFVAPTTHCTIPELLTAVASVQHCRTKPKSAKYSKDQIAKETAKAQVVDLLVGLLASNPGRGIEMIQDQGQLAAWLSETKESKQQYRVLIDLLATVSASRWADIVKRVAIRQSSGTPVLPSIGASIAQVIRHEWGGDALVANQDYGVVQNNPDGTILVQLTAAPYPTFFAMTPQGKTAEMSISLCGADFATAKPQSMIRLITAEISLAAARKGVAAPAKSPAASKDLKALMPALPKFSKMTEQQLRDLMDKGVVVQQDQDRNIMVQVNRAKNPTPVFTLKPPVQGDSLADQQAAQTELQLEIASALKDAGLPYYFTVRPAAGGGVGVAVQTIDNPAVPKFRFKL